MREMPEDVMAGIGALEAYGSHIRTIEAITTWEGMSGGQRLVALAIACLELTNGRGPTPIAVARLTGMAQERIEKAFDNLEHPPYHLTSLPGTGFAFLPCQALEYGEQ